MHVPGSLTPLVAKDWEGGKPLTGVCLGIACTKVPDTGTAAVLFIGADITAHRARTVLAFVALAERKAARAPELQWATVHRGYVSGALPRSTRWPA